MAGFDPKAYLAESDGAAFDPKAYVSESEAPASGGGILDTVQKGLAKLDSYTGAPTRAALYAAETSPTELGRPVAAYKAFVNQFGQDPSRAATGQQIVEAGGFPKNSALSKGAGFVTDMLANPATYVPIGEIIGGGAKLAGKAVGIGAEAAADVAPKASKVVSAAQDITDAAPNAPGRAARLGGTVAETFTGVDRHLAANYMDNTDRINQVMKHYSGPEGYQEAAHAADIRSTWRNVIQKVRQQMNGQISAGLNGEAGQAPISAKSIVDDIDSAISKANPHTQAQDIATLNDLKATLGKMTDEQGNVSLKNLHAFKQYAAKVAAPAYDGAGNAIFPGGDFAAKQAEGIAGNARQILVNNGPKSVSDAEATLAKLHNAEDTMNSTMLKDNGPTHAINRAGTNAGGIESASLKKLREITGYNFEQDAKDFATTRAFAAPKFTPDWNGKSVLRAGIGAGAGLISGHVLGIPAEYAALIGAGATSPGALKAGINLGNIAGKVAMAPIEAAAATPRLAYSAITSPAGKAAVDLGTKAILSSPTPQMAGQGDSQVNRTPARGPDAWASRGVSNLGLSPDQAAKLMQDPKGKQLLIQASELTPGSRALERIKQQIQKGYGVK